MYIRDTVVLYKLNVLKQKQVGCSHFKRSERTALYFSTRKEAELYKEQNQKYSEALIDEKLAVADENNQWLIIKHELGLVNPYRLNHVTLNEVQRHLNIEGTIDLDSSVTSSFSRYTVEVKDVLLGVKFHAIDKSVEGVQFSDDAKSFINLQVRSALFSGHDNDPDRHRPYWKHSYDYTIVKMEKDPVTLTFTNISNDTTRRLTSQVPKF